MPKHLLLLASAFLLGILAGCSSSSVPAQTATGQNKPTVLSDQPFPTLQKGMTADVVRQKLGDPAEIKPMEAPTGKAEVWVYHFEKTVGMTQVATGTRDVPVYTITINGGAEVMVKEPVYTSVAKKAAVTLSLLFYNGQLAAQKANEELSADYK